jgi:hypothetical protein
LPKERIRGDEEEFSQMEFQTEVQREVFEKIRPWLLEAFGMFAMERDDIPAVGIQIGSAFAVVQVHPWGEKEAVINTSSLVVRGAELTFDLLSWLLLENWDFRFGGFAIDQAGDIYFQHSIIGTTCDKPELLASARAVIAVADEYDDKIVARWGGKRITD